MKPLSTRERKFVAIGLLVAVFALVWLGALQPILGGFTARAEQQTLLANQYAQNERMIDRMAGLRRVAEDQRRLGTLYALDAANAEQASDKLKERLAASLEKAGGELRASETIDAPDGWVRVSATALVSNEQLAAWLGMLNNEQPYLVMESLTIVADRALNTGQLDLMDVKIETSIVLDQTNAR
jgi:type II secretory pathway component PulM